MQVDQAGDILDLQTFRLENGNESSDLNDITADIMNRFFKKRAGPSIAAANPDHGLRETNADELLYVVLPRLKNKKAPGWNGVSNGLKYLIRKFPV